MAQFQLICPFQCDHNSLPLPPWSSAPHATTLPPDTQQATERTHTCPLVVVVVQSLSHVQLSVSPWTEARQAPLASTISQSLLKLMSIESVMPPNHLILCHPLLLPSIFPSIRSFPMSQLFASCDQSIGVSASTSVQARSPLGWTGWISLQSKGLSRVFSNTTVQKHQFFSTQLSL